jgi:predicted Zn-dependent peptidase
VKDGVTPEELAKARAQSLRRFIDERRSSLNTANEIGEDAVLFDDPQLINTLAEKEAAVTVEAIHAAAKKYFVRDQRAVVITLLVPKDAAAATGGAQ